MFRSSSAKIKITPSYPVPLGGYALRDGLSVGVHDDLWAKVFLLENEKNCVALISLDVLGVDQDFTRKIRCQAKAQYNIAPENIMVAATHTHSGPEWMPKNLFKGMAYHGAVNEEYRKWVIKQVMAALGRAVSNLTEAEVGWGFTHAFIGGNRRQRNGFHDARLGVLVAKNRNGEKNLLINYSCHPTVLDYTNYLISADFPGAACRNLEQSGFQNVLFFNGSAGNISTRFYRSEPTFAEVERFGKNLSEAVESLIDFVELMPLTIIDSQEKHILLPGKNNRYIQTWIQWIRMDKLNIIGIPLELFSEIGAKLTSALNPAFVVGYANDYLGYLPTNKAFEEGGYEIEVTSFSPEAGDVLVEEVIKWSREIQFL